MRGAHAAASDTVDTHAKKGAIERTRIDLQHRTRAVLVGRLGRIHRLLENLHFGVGEWRDVDAERIDAGLRRALAVFDEKRSDAGKVHGGFGHVEVVGDDVVPGIAGSCSPERG